MSNQLQILAPDGKISSINMYYINFSILVLRFPNINWQWTPINKPAAEKVESGRKFSAYAACEQ